MKNKKKIAERLERDEMAVAEEIKKKEETLRSYEDKTLEKNDIEKRKIN